MAKYTTLVRSICEVKSGFDESKGEASVNQILDSSWDKIFDNEFPIYDESYRKVLCKKILKHYYMREIGAETVGLWTMWLNERMELIMPYYNQLYESALLKFNPMYDVDVTTTGDNKGSGNENGIDTRNVTSTRTDNLKEDNTLTRTDNLKESVTGSSSTDNWSNYQDTPQGGLTGVQSEEYLTNARHDYGNSNDSSNRDNTGTVQSVGSTINSGTVTSVGNDENSNSRSYSNLNDYTEHVVGKRGGVSNSKMLQEFRETFLNIDSLIINELSDLFMLVY